MPVPSVHPQGRNRWWVRSGSLLIAVSLLALVWALADAFRAARRTAAEVALRGRTYQTLRLLDGAMTDIQELDSTQRGFLVTGNPAYLDHRRATLGRWQARQQDLDAALAPDPSQVRDLASLKSLLVARMAVEDAVLAAKQAGDERRMLAVIAASHGVGGMDDIVAVHQRLEAREFQRVESREGSVLAAQGRAFRALGIVSALAALLVATGLAMMLGLHRSGRRAEEAWRHNLDILDETPDFVASVHPGGAPIHWNPALRRLRGLGEPQRPTEPFAALFTPGSWQAFTRDALPAASDAGRWSGEAEWVAADGTPVPVSLVLLAHRNANRVLIAYSAIARSLEEQKAAERLKRDFIASVNHEIRTPLSAIRGALGLLAQPSRIPGQAQEDLLAIAARNCERLGVLINDLLDIERLESGAMPFALAAWDLDGLVDAAARNLQTLILPQGGRLVREGGTRGACVQVDEARFAQILTNLISNAVKFSPPGAPVRIRTAQGLESGGSLRVEVENAGEGVPEAFRARIFQPFNQADRPTGAKPGTGLGLVITKRLTERMGGRIGYESAPGRTVFWVEFPQAAAHPGLESAHA